MLALQLSVHGSQSCFMREGVRCPFARRKSPHASLHTRIDQRALADVIRVRHGVDEREHGVHALQRGGESINLAIVGLFPFNAGPRFILGCGVLQGGVNQLFSQLSSG